MSCCNAASSPWLQACSSDVTWGGGGEGSGIASHRSAGFPAAPAGPMTDFRDRSRFKGRSGIMSTPRAAVAVFLAVTVILTSGTAGLPATAVSVAPPPILLEGTVVTMNAGRDVIHNGRVLVRDGRIAAVWQGGRVPADLDLAGAVRVPLGPHAYIYPGLINLHDHPFFDVLPVW